MRLMVQYTLTLLFALLLSACGGGSSLGDGGSGGGGTNPSASVVVLQLLNAQGTETVEVTTDGPINVVATVTTDGQPASNVKVLFSLDDEYGELRVTSALTNSEGVASVELFAGTKSGAGTVTATVDSSSAATNFSAVVSDGGNGTVNPLSLTLKDINGVATLNVSSASPINVEANLVIDGQPQMGEKVTFRLVDQVGELRITTALTNSEGNASVVLYAGINEGAGTIAATVGDFFQERNFSVSISAVDVTMSEITTTPDNIGPNGTASLSVKFEESVNGVSTPLSGSVPVEFSSACSQLGRALIDSDVTTINGVATATYQDQGCGQVDTITVTATVGQNGFFETTELNVAGADVGSIEFVSAEPTFIALKGTGGVSRSETSTLVFKVKDDIGNAVRDELVNFSLNTDVGGITISPEQQAKTNSEGEVTVIVAAGTVPTSVIVTASLAKDPLIATISGNLSISTGVLDANSFSISVSNHVPEALNYDGEVVEVTARLADHFNNPVPDGTTVNFSTEFGAIEPQCLTVKGACSVEWSSQAPKAPDPAFRDPNAVTRQIGKDTCYINNIITDLHEAALPCPGTLGSVHGDRVTIFAYAIGEESFNDANANGRFNEGEAYTDLSEAFQDDNHDGLFTALLADGTPVTGAAANNAPGRQTGGDNEEYVDFNGNQEFDGPNGIYNGVLCNDEQNGCSEELVTVSRNAMIHQAGSAAYIGMIEGDANLSIADKDDYYQPVSLVTIIEDDPATTDVDESQRIKLSKQVIAYIADIHNGPMPTGTEVTFETTNGEIVGKSSFILGSRGVEREFVVIKADDEPSNGFLTVRVETPRGVLSSRSIAIVD